jgi:hypothetical protein
MGLLRMVDHYRHLCPKGQWNWPGNSPGPFLRLLAGFERECLEAFFCLFDRQAPAA